MSHPIPASSATIGTRYLTQRGLEVAVTGRTTLGTQVKNVATGTTSTLEDAHLLTPLPASDVDAPTLDVANVIGRPRATIEGVLCDLTDAQLNELLEADTRMWVEFVVAKEREVRAEKVKARAAVDIVNAVAKPVLLAMARDQLAKHDPASSAANGILPDGTTSTPDAAQQPGNVTQFPRVSLPSPTVAALDAIAQAPTPEAREAAIGVFPGFIETADTIDEGERSLTEEENAAAEAALVASEPTLIRVSPEVPDGLTAEPAATPDPEPPAPPAEGKRFPRATCPVCGHVGMLTASGKVRAHQHAGHPCQGQQALGAVPSTITSVTTSIDAVTGTTTVTTRELDAEGAALTQDVVVSVTPGTPLLRFDDHGDPRPTSDMDPEARARALYNSWSNIDGWVPWVENGNSLMQDKARDESRTAPTGASDYAAPQFEMPEWNKWSPVGVISYCAALIDQGLLAQHCAVIIDGLNDANHILTNLRLNDALEMLEEHGAQADLDKLTTALKDALATEVRNTSRAAGWKAAQEGRHGGWVEGATPQERDEWQLGFKAHCESRGRVKAPATPDNLGLSAAGATRASEIQRRLTLLAACIPAMVAAEEHSAALVELGVNITTDGDVLAGGDK